MRKLPLASIAVVCITLGGCATSSKLEMSPTGTVIPPTQKTGRLMKTAQPDIVGELKKFNERKISVPFFTVTFDKSAGESASTTMAGSGSASSVSKQVNAKLVGVSEQTFDEITQLAYRDLVQRLGQAGFQVVPVAAIADTRTLKKLKTAKPKNSSKVAVRHGASGKQLGKITYGMDIEKIMYDTRVAVAKVDYGLNFASFGTATRSRVDSASASVSLGQVAHATGNITVYGMRDANCRAMKRCAQNGSGGILRTGQFPYSTTPMGELKDTTPGWFNIAQIFLQVLGSGADSTQYELQATDAAYKKAALEALTEANKRFVAKMRAS